jgi:hypothetical protein
MPKLQSGAGGMGDSTWQEKAVTAGRLICDSYLSAKVLSLSFFFEVLLILSVLSFFLFLFFFW